MTESDAQDRLDEAHRQLDDADWRGSAGDGLAPGEWAAAVAAVRDAEAAVAAARGGGDPIRALWRGRSTLADRTFVVELSGFSSPGLGVSYGGRSSAPWTRSSPTSGAAAVRRSSGAVTAARPAPGKGAGEGGARGSVSQGGLDMDAWLRSRGGRR